MKKLPLKTKMYFVSIYLITLICIFYSAFNNLLPGTSIKYIDVVFFVVLITVTESFTVVFQRMCFSTSFPIQLATYLLFGPYITLLIIILGFSARVLKVGNSYKHIFNTPIYGTLINYCVFILSVLSSNYVYLLYGGTISVDTISSNMFQIILFCLVFFIVDFFIISIVTALMTNKDIIYVFIGNIKLIILNILVMAPFGVILAYLFNIYSYGGVLIVLVPILLTKYTFSLYVQSKSQYVETVDALMLAMEARDKYTEGHSQRVAELSTSIAKELKYNDWKIEQLNMAALLHDVGKIGINDEILNKPGKLTIEQYDIIKTHPLIGYNILKNIKNLQNILPIIRNHHERYDAKGYPDGIGPDAISIDVFIVQLADAIDAMTTDRPYRKALDHEMVIEEIKKCSGSQFHPKVVQAYFKMLEKQKKQGEV